MTASASVIGFGSTFKWNNVAIAELTKIGGVKLSVKTADITSFDSDDGYKEIIPTILDGGSFDIEGFLTVSDTTGQVAMLTDFHAKTKRQWIITFTSSTGTTWTGYGYLTAFETGDINIDGVLTFKATIETTGKPALAISASTGGTFIVTGNNGAGVVNPASAAGVYEYVVTLSAGATSYTLTPTIATSTITLLDSTGAIQTIITANASTSLAAPANGIHTIYLMAQETGKAKLTYVIHVVEPV